MPIPKHELLRRLIYPYKIFDDFKKLVERPTALTYYPEVKRKEKLTILSDMLSWFTRHREVNRFYYVYGMDRKDDDRQGEVIGLKMFRGMRDHANQRLRGLDFNYVSLLRDKFVFGQFLKSLQFPTPRNIALIDKEYITWLDDMSIEPIQSIVSGSGTIDGFCKKLTGIKGVGSFPLQIQQGKLYSRGNEISLHDLLQNIDETYLYQERIRQHPDMSILHPASVNTIRMITFNNKGKIDVFCATQRIGAHGHSVDNWASGGIVVGIDLQSGTLRKEGLFKPGKGGRVEMHPETGVVFNGYKIPFFNDSIKMATSLHRYFYGIHSIGWDIAISDNGPVFIEGNDDWDGTIAMSLEKDFKQRFMKMFSNKF